MHPYSSKRDIKNDKKTDDSKLKLKEFKEYRHSFADKKDSEIENESKQ